VFGSVCSAGDSLLNKKFLNSPLTSSKNLVFPGGGKRKKKTSNRLPILHVEDDDGNRCALLLEF